MKKIKTILILSIVLVMMFAVGCQKNQQASNVGNENADATDLSSVEPMKITFGHMDLTQPNMLMHGVCLYFKDCVETASNGQITVDVIGGGALGSAADLLEQVRTGQIQFGGSITEANIAGFWDDINMLGSPYIFRSVELAMDVMDSDFGTAIKDKILETTGVRVPFVFSNGGMRHFTNNVRPIKTPADMKGLKIRTMDSPAHMEVVKALGASPTPIAWTETYTALQTGVVDGQENGISSILQGKMQEVQKYMSTDGHVASFMFVVMNDKWYQNLPPANKAIMDEAFRKTELFSRRYLTVLNSIGRGTIEAAGVEIHDTTPEELALFQEATKDVKNYIKENLMSDPTWMDRLEEAIAKSEARMGYVVK
jgi:tripartite ATP-independent transporter DctP family solute receptor